MAMCRNCGFLAVRDEYNDSVCEATDLTRSKGLHASSLGNATKAKVFCFKGSPAFQSLELSGQAGIVAGISEEIECDLFCGWHPGRTPREHEEMMHSQLLQIQESIRRQEDLQWRKDVEEALDRRHQENKRELSQQRTMDRVVQFLLALLGAVVALTAARLLPWLFG